MSEDGLIRQHEQDLEFSAQIAALRILLGQLYGSAFEGREQDFRQFMRGLMEQTARVGVDGDASDEERMELRARINVHLERFAATTAGKIRVGRV